MTNPSDPLRDSQDAATTPIGLTLPCAQCGAPMPAFETRCAVCGAFRAQAGDGDERAQLLQRLQRGIGDAFQLIELIGKGGMGVVFRAREKALDREVALKVLAFDPQLVPDAFARFEREARLAARLDHAHIVPIFSVGQGQGIAYYTMRLVRGGNLEELLKSEERLSPVRAIKYLREIASALDHAHANGVVHRDVKPANVMLGEGDHVLVADFGIARAIGGEQAGVTSTGVVGSPAYMAPEQWQGQGIDGRADQYALGILAYELLTGKRPYRDATMQQLLRLHLTEELPDISLDLPKASRAVREALARATAKDPKDRFATTAAFVTALDQALTDRAATAQSPVPREGASAAVERNEKHGARRLLPIGLVVIAGVGAFAFLSSRGDRVPALPPSVSAPPETVVVTTPAVPETVRVQAPAPPAGDGLSYIAVFHPMTLQGRVLIDGVTVLPRTPPVFAVTPGRHIVTFLAQVVTIPAEQVVRVKPGDTVRAMFVPVEGGGARGDQLRQQVRERIRREQQGLPGGLRGGGMRGNPNRPPPRGGQLPPARHKTDSTVRKPPPPLPPVRSPMTQAGALREWRHAFPGGTLPSPTTVFPTRSPG